MRAQKSNAIKKSVASAQKCVDKRTPKLIARAENCFDYFTLAVSWSPGYAYKQLRTGKRINAKKIRPSWIIHGLWPSMFRGSPMPTCGRTDIYFNRNRLVANKILNKLEKNWYTILDKQYSDNKKFWEYEFNKHGSCATRSSVIGDDVNYFGRTLELFSQLSIDTTFVTGRYKVGTTAKVRDIINMMRKRLNAIIKVNFVPDPVSI